MKTIIKYSLITLLAGGCIFLLSMIYKKVENKKIVAEKIKHLVKVPIQSISGQKFVIGNEAKNGTVLLFFALISIKYFC